jgi:hypothetical protein
MILIIMVATLFFCHSLARLAIDLTIGGSPGNRDDTHDFVRIPSIAGPGGYAMPRTPIHTSQHAGTGNRVGNEGAAASVWLVEMLVRYRTDPSGRS